MAVNIGPKIGIDGEAEYRKQLQDIIQQQKTLKAEMQETASGFDKNTTAMEKAKAKAENLNKQIEIQKTRVEEAKKMVEQSTEKYGEADSRTQKWKEALANASTELNNLQKELKDTNPVKAFSDDLKTAADKLDKISNTIGTVGDTLTKKVTMPIMAVGGASIAAFNDVDKGMDIVIKKTGATGEALNDMQDRAKALAKTMPVSFEEAGTAIGGVATRFDLAGEDLEKLSEKFLQFAQINDTDVSGAIDNVQAAMAAFNVKSEDAGDVLDMLTKASQNTGVSVDKLSSDLTTNAAALTEMGFGVNASVGFLSKLNKNGLDSSTVMSGLKKALANATSEGKTMDQALSDLQKQLQDASSDTEAMQAVMDLFGNKAGPALTAAIKDGRLSFDEFSNTIQDWGDVTSTTFEATLDAPDRFRVVMNNVKDVGAEVGATLLESLTPAIQTVGEAVQKAAEWWNGLDESQQKTILTVAGVVAAIGPVLTVVSKLGHGVSTVMTFASGLTSSIAAAGGLIPAITALGSTLLPVIGVIAGVAAVIAGVVLAIKNWDKITAWFSKTWETVTTAVSDAATAVGDWVSEKWNNIKEWTSEAWGNVKETVSNAWNNVKTTVSDAVNKVGSWVSEKWDNIKAKTKETWDNVKAKVAENGGGIKGIIKTAVDGYQNIWQTGFNAINNLTGGKLGEVVTKVSNKLNDIKQKFTDKFNSIKDFVSGIIEKIKGFFNFKWELPKIKLPHFSISGKFSLAPPSIPRISVEWYRKAYNNPVMFTQPTVLATTSGLKGFGDGSGGEIVIGQSMLYAMIRDAAEAGMRSESYTYGDVVVNVYAQPGQDVEELADIVSERIDQQIRRREAAFA
ncbi:MAG: phage tail tape measure protein [Oscillospiraceae bacterium]|nr:phage tail tape measure protein [Oscillospiraceae bacterium]